MPKRTLGSEVAQPLSPDSFPNPFAKWASEQEPRLKEFFVRGPLFGALFREEEDVETRFVFGPPGSGKTAYRLMLERRYRPQQRHSPILAAHYFDTSSWRHAAKPSNDQITPWRMLQDTLLEALARDLLIDPHPFFALVPPRRALLAKFFQEQTPLHQPLVVADWLHEWKYDALADAVEAQDVQYATRWKLQWELLEILRAPSDVELPTDDVERLHALVMLLERCGLKQMLMLVDGVDKFVEKDQTHDALHLLLPLCHTLQALEEMHIAVHFFLPQELAVPLREGGVRFDRYKRYELVWSDEMLTELLQQRLESVSEGKISSLGQLAEEHAPQGKNQKLVVPLSQRLDHELVTNAHGSPRQLIRLATALFDAYANRAPRDGLFTQLDLETALKTEKVSLKRDSLVPPLVIDEQLERVSIGERELQLTAKELECLILLKQANGETLSREEIWKKLYPKQATEPSPAQTDPFFSRLRKKLERDTRHPVYLVTDRERGFHLENVAE